ncbi:MAG: outer membrane protein, partial [Halothiobacillaceae bacterium]
DLNFRRNEEIGKLQALVKQIIEKVGKDEKYDLILFDGIAYANERIDLTDKILKRLQADMNQPTASERSPK